MDDLKVFSGNAHPALAQAIADYLGMPLGRAEVFEFANENIFVRINLNRTTDIVLITSARGILSLSSLSAHRLIKAWWSCLS